MSQEALSEVLGTTRQAVSKWENNQRCPDVEKILVLANIFHVSVDYLLKDDADEEEDGSYYISREKAEGYLLYHHKVVKVRAVGIFFIICSVIPCFFLQEDSMPQLFSSVVLLIVGIGIIATQNFYENEYKGWKNTALLLDGNYLEQLKHTYTILRKKYFTANIIATILLFVGCLCSIYADEYLKTGGNTFSAIGILLIALSLSIFGYVSAEKRAYEMLLHNKEHMNRWTIRIWNKINSKF